MDAIKGPLILDLVEWVAVRPRTYSEVMAAWRTSCPRLTIWEDAADQGYVARQGSVVTVTPHGLALLHDRRRVARQPAAA